MQPTETVKLPLRDLRTILSTRLRSAITCPAPLRSLVHRVCKIDQRGCCGGLNASREIPALVDALERNRAGGLVVGCLQLNVDGVVRRNPTMHSLTEWNRQRNFGVKKTGGAFLPEIQKCFLQCMPFAAKPSAAEGRVVWLERPGIHLRLQVGIRRDLQRIEQRSSRKKKSGRITRSRERTDRGKKSKKAY